MRIAVACEGLGVAPRYEFCESYMCYTVDHGVIVDGQNMPSPGVDYRQVASILKELDVRVLIVGSIDPAIADLYCNCDIDVIAGAFGNARRVVERYLTDELIGIDELCCDEEDDDEEESDEDFDDFD